MAAGEGKPLFQVRDAVPADGDAILQLMPRLADFDVPETRNPEHLWRDDARLLQSWMNREADCLVYVAEDDGGDILGFSMARLRPELLSSAPSAHLEAIAITTQAEGRGVARALLDATEQGVAKQGAQTLTLHVFANNVRARRFYERAGYDGELMRYIRHLDEAT